jgi:hypothetical protein
MLLVAAVLTAVVLLVALTHGPAPRRSAAARATGTGSTIQPPALTAWCAEEHANAIATMLGETWACAWSDNGFFRHASVDDGPCRDRFGPSSVATHAPDGVHCTTP